MTRPARVISPQNAFYREECWCRCCETEYVKGTRSDRKVAKAVNHGMLGPRLRDEVRYRPR